MYCSSSVWFPSSVGVRLVNSPLRSTATFVGICFHWSLLLAFSLHFSSSSAFLRSLFTQSSHLSYYGLPRFLQSPCFFASDIFGNLSSFLIMCPAHFIRLLTIFQAISTNWVLLAGTTKESRTFPFSCLEIFVSNITPPRFSMQSLLLVFCVANLHRHSPVLRPISTQTHNIIYLLFVFPFQPDV